MDALQTGVAVFWGAAFVSVVSAVSVILIRSTIYAALVLVVHLVAVAALFVLLMAEFLAAVQVVVYAGAIMVLFLFVIMMLGLERVEEGSLLVGQGRWGLVLGSAVAVLVVLAVAAGGTELGLGPGGDPSAGADNTAALGRELFTQNVLAFEAVSVLLLVAMVGAVVLAKRRL